MKKLLSQLKKSYHLFYLSMVFVAGIGLIFLVFPAESRFKYEFQKGSPWRHETLIAPFNFAILKTAAEIQIESDSVLKAYIPYFTLDTLVENTKVTEFITTLSNLTETNPEIKSVENIQYLPQILQHIYNSGILPQSINSYGDLSGNTEINQITGNIAVSYTHLRAHETRHDLVCRLLLEK